MDRQKNVLFGKLAIVRGFLSREAASECFQKLAQNSDQKLNLWDLAVSRGHMPMGQAQTLIRMIDHGQFRCPKCSWSCRLSEFPTDQNFVCQSCQGAVQIEPLPTLKDSGEVPILRAADSGIHNTEQKSSSASKNPSSKPSPESSPQPKPVNIRATSSTSLVAGQSFARFQISRPIGRGGMGMVYKAKDPKNERVVAVKILLEKAADNPQTIDRFIREVKVASRLKHAHIVEVVDAGFTEGLYWMAMEFVEGRDMQRWRNEDGRSIGQGIGLMTKICEGVAHAHSRMIVHRDLKPGNIMVSWSGDVPKICDFGLAKALSERSGLTKTGDILGTPYYMSPEQAMGKHLLIGPPTDVWALGVMLYEMVTGRLPFTGRTTFQILRAIATEKVKSPSDLGIQVPPPFEAIIMKCLEQFPQKRFVSAGELRDSLSELMG